jgi:hypothetical protein
MADPVQADSAPGSDGPDRRIKSGYHALLLDELVKPFSDWGACLRRRCHAAAFDILQENGLIDSPGHCKVAAHLGSYSFSSIDRKRQRLTFARERSDREAPDAVDPETAAILPILNRVHPLW